jgi:hypothetical protein
MLKANQRTNFFASFRFNFFASFSPMIFSFQNGNFLSAFFYSSFCTNKELLCISRSIRNGKITKDLLSILVFIFQTLCQASKLLKALESIHKKYWSPLSLRWLHWNSHCQVLFTAKHTDECCTLFTIEHTVRCSLTISDSLWFRFVWCSWQCTFFSADSGTLMRNFILR